MSGLLVRWLGRTPLGASILALRARREAGLVALYALVAAVVATSLSTLVSERAVRAFVASHHLRPSSLPAWAWVQLVPKMYSFGNRCWIGDSPLLDGEGSEDRFEREAFWVNHYPARRARFDAGRAGLPAGRLRHVLVRSSYQAFSQTTSYAVTRREDGLWVELRWVWP